MASRTINSPISTIGLDPDYRTAVRGFERVAMSSAESIEDFIPMLYSAKKFTPKTITFPVYGPITDAVAWNGKEVILPASISYLYDVSATSYIYANSVAVTKEETIFDLYGIGNPLNAELGKSAASKRQKLAGAFFNDGFDTAWYDGVYFFSASHPYAPNSGIASTTYQSNLISGALSHATLEDMITAGRGFKDPMGRPIPQSPQTLFVDPSNEEYARYLLNDGMGLKSETSNNDKNPYSRFGIKVVSYPYFELTTQYMMKFSGAKSYVNDMIPIGPLPNVPQANHSIKTDIFFVIAFWEENWTGWVGSTGV